MSRESDHPSPTPPRPNGGAYPSGTPPYGVPSDPAFSRAGQPSGTAQPQEPAAEESRTETTMTTRIRINIPGSRPIPPVVVRSPMGNAQGAEPPAAEAQEPNAAEPPSRHRHRAEAPGTSPVLGVMDGGGTTTPPDLPMEWRTQGGEAGQGADAAPAAAPEADASTWFAPRKKSRPAAPAQQPQTQQPQPPQPQPQPQQAPFEPPQAFAPPQQQFAPQPQAEPQFDPRFEQQFAPQPAPPQQTQPFPQQTLAPRPVPRGPRAQPQGLANGFNAGLAASAATAPAEAPSAPPQAPPPMRNRKGGQRAAASRPPQPTDEFDATAALPVFRDEPEPPRAARVPDGFAGGTGGAGAPPRRPGDAGATAGSESATSAAPKKAGKKRGKARKLLVTGIGALVMAAGVAYGTGLMLNQADVPRGTTVLGNNIGGDTTDAAVATLDDTVGKIAAEPLQVSVNGRTVSLDPSVAGLTVDTTATVQGVAHHTYNPVTVIRSLIGDTHAVTPVVVVDQDKLRYALQQLSTGTGSAHEGSVHFKSDGTVVTVLPQAGQGLDVNAAMALVQRAYEARATGTAGSGGGAPVVLPVTSVQPVASAAAVQQAASTLGAWAMRQDFKVSVQGTVVPFGPHTFSKALSLQPNAAGVLVPVFDLAKLQSAYAGNFDGLEIKGGPVTPQEIASALIQLLSKPGGPTSVTL